MSNHRFSFKIALCLHLFLLFSGLANAQETSDFSKDVQTLLQKNMSPQKDSPEEFISAWDEFGMNTVTKGELPQSEISRTIDQDILNSVKNELIYDLQESTYLKTTHSSPEEIQTTEEADGSDVPKDILSNPHPSLETDSSVDLSGIETVATTTPTDDQISQEGGTSADQNTPNLRSVDPVDTTPASDTEIFNAILQSEESSSRNEPPDETTSSESQPLTPQQ